MICALIVGISACVRKKIMPVKSINNCKVYDRLPEDIQRPLNISYNQKAILMGINRRTLYKKKLLKISYYWKIQEELTPFHMVFVHITDKDNRALSQNDHFLCQNLPFKDLKDRVTKETYIIDIPQSALGKDILIKVGIYVPELAPPNRLKIDSAGEIPLDDDNTRAVIDTGRL